MEYFVKMNDVDDNYEVIELKLSEDMELALDMYPHDISVQKTKQNVLNFF
jgi:hypothetical protein